MNSMKMFALAAALCLTAGCSKKKDTGSENPTESAQAEPPGDQAPTTPTAAPQTKSESPTVTDPAVDSTDGGAAAPEDVDPQGDWVAFFGEFKAAAAAKDKAKLAELTHVGEAIDQGTLDELADTFLTKEVLETLATTDPASITPKDEDGEMVYEFSWMETSIVDGEEMGSGLFFYFKKVDGQLKLFRLLAAG